MAICETCRATNFQARAPFIINPYMLVYRTMATTNDTDDAWGEVFALAEGKDTKVSYGKMEAEADPERSALASRARYKRKRDVVSKSASSPLNEEEAYTAFLESRTVIGSSIPQWIRLGETFTSHAVCKGWAVSRKEYKQGTCRRCRRSAVHHLAEIDPKFPWWCILFVGVRNLRCIAVGSILRQAKEKEGSLEGPDTILRYVGRRIWKELDTGMIHGSIIRFPTLQAKWKIFRSSLHSVLHSKADKEFLDKETAFRWIIHSDAIYYQLYYLQLTRQIPLLPHDADTVRRIPHPSEYFGQSQFATDHQQAKIALRLFLQRTETNTPRASDWTDRFGWTHRSSAKHGHILETLHEYRMLETVLLFDFSGLVSTTETITAWFAQVSPSNQLDQHDTPAPPLWMAWRDSCRDFLCHLYAYATISQSVISQLPSLLSRYGMHQGIIEAGAGTGYIANLFIRAGISTEAFDVHPTNSGSNSSSVHNGYHGATPSYVSVRQGKSSALHKYFSHTLSKALLLCYPPPDSTMAYDALRSFVQHGGSLFVHVGEFRGLTGNSTFEQLLMDDFALLQRFPCLPWGTDAAELTIWRRRKASDNTSKSRLLPCSSCGTRESVQRLRLVRYLTYCSAECAQQHQPSISEHLRWAFLPPMRIDWKDDRFFAIL